MPAPIAITRTHSDLDSFGTPRVGSLTVPGSASFREAMAMSFGKEVNDIMDYSISKFATSTDSDATALPSTSMTRQLEKTFCRNFTCCGQALDDLHDLLQHYEECHVRFEDDDLPAMISDDDLSSASSSSLPPSPRAPNASSTTELKRRAALAAAAASGADVEGASAFDTAVMRSPSAAAAAAGKGKKRSFGQYTSGSHNAVHQSLRRALIDGGVGRMNGRDIYSANSPFSTPDSSMPGTPLGDDSDAAFFGHAGVPSFSSLSLRNANEEHNLPSCAPPNLFFPSANANATQPPAKRERINSAGASVASGAAPESHISRPGATLVVDKPFKCPSPGCDKAYKQMNGLKYHRIHGQCNQNKLVASAAPSGATTPIASTSRAPTPAVAPSAAAAVARPVAPQPNRPTLNLQTSLASATASPQSSAPPSPCSSVASLASDAHGKVEKMYLCQVGACGKRYKNLNGLRYHYLHSGSHGLLGLALLSSNGGGQSARVDTATGRPAVTTSSLTSAQLAAAAEAAVAAQNAAARPPTAVTSTQIAAALAQASTAAAAAQQQATATGCAASPLCNVNATIAHPSLPLGPSPKLA